MLRNRIIPCLLLRNESLVKTVNFKKPSYIGDSINTVRIFNELEVDELVFLDIMATREKRGPNFQILQEISNECFMPLAYGGGIRNLDDIKKIFKIGFEKIAINSYAMENPSFVTEVANVFGSQSIIGSIDVRKNFWGKYEVITHCGTKKQRISPVDWAKRLEELGVGEIFLTAIHQEGTWNGYDIELIKLINDTVNIPIIANGGAGNLDHIHQAIHQGNVSAVALGSMVVYQNKGMGVLVSFPDKEKLEKVIQMKSISYPRVRKM